MFHFIVLSINRLIYLKLIYVQHIPGTVFTLYNCDSLNFFFILSLWSKHYCHLYFFRWETEWEILSNFPKLTQLVKGRDGIWLQYILASGLVLLIAKLRATRITTPTTTTTRTITTTTFVVCWSGASTLYAWPHFTLTTTLRGQLNDFPRTHS